MLVMAMVTSLMVALPSGMATADTISPLKWPAKTIGRTHGSIVASPSGEVTVGCSLSGGQDLVTYSSTGAVIRQVSHTSKIDGVDNCISDVAVDKVGDVYGIPFGHVDASSWSYGSNLLAYRGNSVKWKYPLHCGIDQRAQYTVGANGNIYATQRQGDGVHLIGIAPNLKTGQTIPSKMLDIKLPVSDCSTELRAYKYGIVTHGQLSGGARFYSYGGKFLGTTPGRIWDEKVSTDGRLFSYSYQNQAGYRSVSASVYSPQKGAIEWTTQLSTVGADASVTTLEPLSEGGLAALTQEQVMTAEGIPASPKSYRPKIVILDARGKKVRATTLPIEDNQGNSYGTTVIIPNTTNGLTVVRELERKTGVSWPYTVPEIMISSVNTGNGTVIYSGVIGGTIEPHAQYGYSLDSYTDRDYTMSQGVLFMPATCSSTCTGDRNKLYALTTPEFGMDYPRGAVLTANMPQQPAAVSYVGLGDSYSSGWGAGKYEDGTATSTNTCRRSARAYAHVLHGDPYSPLRLDKFIACGGATAPRITSTWPNTGDKLNLDEPAQLSAVTSSTRVVTLTMGGNDVGFADVIKGCAINCSRAVTTATNSINTTLAPALTKAYKAILGKSTKADVYVLGYPPMLSASATLCASSAPFNSATKRKLGIDLLNQLNAKIRTTVAAVGSPRMHYLDPTATGSPFIGHDICSKNPYVYGLNAADIPAGLFHPSINGQVAYAKMVTTYLIANPLR